MLKYTGIKHVVLDMLYYTGIKHVVVHRYYLFSVLCSTAFAANISFYSACKAMIAKRLLSSPSARDKWLCELILVKKIP